MTNYKNFPKYLLCNKGYVEAVEDEIIKNNPSNTSSDINDKVEEVLKTAGFFHSKNRRPVKSKREHDGSRK